MAVTACSSTGSAAPIVLALIPLPKDYEVVHCGYVPYFALQPKEQVQAPGYQNLQVERDVGHPVELPQCLTAIGKASSAKRYGKRTVGENARQAIRDILTQVCHEMDMVLEKMRKQQIDRQLAYAYFAAFSNTCRAFSWSNVATMTYWCWNIAVWLQLWQLACIPIPN